MTHTPEAEVTLEERVDDLGNGTITNHSGGYRSLMAAGPLATVAYVELPAGHPDSGKDYNAFRPRVNGGLTYGEGRVYGWDYGHAYNSSDVEMDVKVALRYFRRRSKARAAIVEAVNKEGVA